MGTPGYVIVRDEHGNAMVCAHYQCDGYPDGMQLDKVLAAAGIKGEITMVNGYTMEDKDKYPGVFNTASCFAAYLVGAIVQEDKNGIGHIYLQPAADEYKFGYTYIFECPVRGRPIFKVIYNYEQKVLFEGFFEDCDFMDLEGDDE
jgi:hypothetical protein